MVISEHVKSDSNPQAERFPDCSWLAESKSVFYQDHQWGVSLFLYDMSISSSGERDIREILLLDLDLGLGIGAKKASLQDTLNRDRATGYGFPCGRLFCAMMPRSCICAWMLDAGSQDIKVGMYGSGIGS